nr:zinc finger, GRF-type [Tanacetum cinerariifolium]
MVRCSKCDSIGVIRTSWTSDNSGRRFYCCSKKARLKLKLFKDAAAVAHAKVAYFSVQFSCGCSSFRQFVHLRSAVVTDNTKGPLCGSDFRGNEMVMDFQNSKVYMLSEKGDVTNIATPSGFMTAFSGCFDIMSDIFSTEGCQCSFSTLGTIATEGHRCSMTSGHQKEQEKVHPSIAKCSSHEVEIPLNSAKTKKKHSKFGGLRGKRMMTSASCYIQQNGATHTFMSPVVQDKGKGMVREGTGGVPGVLETSMDICVVV